MASFNALLPCLALVFSLFSLSSEARDFMLDNRSFSWKVPSPADEFTRWAEKERFQVGDYLVMQYDGMSDSVLLVTKEDFDQCNMANPIEKFNDGNTRIMFDRSGFFYMISGAQGHCANGQKLAIQVLSQSHNPKSPHPPASATSPPSPSISSAPATSPAPAPSPVSTSHGHGLGFEAVGIAMVFGSLIGLLALV